MAVTDWWRFPGIVGLVLLAACGGQDEVPVPTLPGDTLAFEAPAVEGDSAGGGVALAQIQENRREMASADSVFPHSEHRSVECQRCHQRPAGHVTHRDQPCQACHGRPAGFASLPQKTPEQCAGCHHQNPAQLRCRSCHPASAVGARSVEVAIKATGAAEPRVRPLTFDHSDHASQECLTCHTTSVTLQFGRTCASCHEYHHRQDAPCMTCHVQVQAAVHSDQVHAGCAGGGCHDQAPVLSLRPTRNVCEVCHQDRVDHRPGRECTECHVGFGDNLREEQAQGGGR